MQLLKNYWQLALIVVLTAILYAPSLLHGFAPIDDAALILENPLITKQSWASLYGIFTSFDPELYLPLTLLTFKTEYFFFGANPLPFHTTNLVLHLFNVILVFCLSSSIVKNRNTAALCALLFALHPLHTDTIMWASARKDLLLTVLSLLTLLSYQKYILTKRTAFYYLTIPFLLLALLSKVSAFTLPLIFLLIDYKEGGPKGISMLKNKWSHFALSGAFLFIGLQHKVLTVYHASYFETFLLACKSATHLLQQLIFPFDLSIYESVPLPITLLNVEYLFPVLIAVSLIVITYASKRIYPMVFFCLLFFFFALLPSLASFTAIDTSHLYLGSSRYAYLASIGILMLASMGIVELLKKQKLLITVLLMLIVVGYGGMAVQRSSKWGEIIPKQEAVSAIK